MPSRSLPLGLSAALLLSLSARGSLRPGQYHDGATLLCGECHVMHGSTAPDASSDGPRRALDLQSAGVLLKKDVNELCLTCHDDSAVAADVLGANRGSQPGAVRQAGFLNHVTGSGRELTGHTLGSLDAAPGSSPTWRPEDENGPGQGLDCTNCHAPHGEEHAGPSYRNLRSDAGTNPPGAGLVTYNDRPGVNDPTRDVFLRRALDYDESAVDFNEPDTTDSAMGRFCAGCHGEFHGSPGSAAIGGTPQGDSYTGFVRHPAAGVDIGASGEGGSSLRRFETLSNRVKVMSGLGVWDPAAPDATPTCITCHKAHGNANPFGLIYRSGFGTPTENGDSRGGTLEHLCGQCHAESSLLARR